MTALRNGMPHRSAGAAFQTRAASAEERFVERFVWDAESILETAVAASGGTATEPVICLSRTGSLQILSDITGWSLPALAAELGAAAVYRVTREGAVVRVEGWSYGRKCVLTRDSSHEWWVCPPVSGACARVPLLAAGAPISM